MTRIKKITIRARFQDSPTERIYYEEFKADAVEDVTVAEILRRQAADPGNLRPVVWEDGCGTRACGACAMLINGIPRLACEAKVWDYPPAPITLEPLTKFPLKRDLLVDKSTIFESAWRMEHWLETGNYKPVHEFVPPGEEQSEEARKFGSCIKCGICVEVCPGCNTVADFTGSYAVASCASYLHVAQNPDDIKRLLKCQMEPSGVTGCGNSMNCMKFCPKEIDLTAAIAFVNRRINDLAFRSMFGKQE